MKRTVFNENWTCNGAPVTLPHDAMIHEKRDPNAACGSAGAFFPGGRYVYEKHFERPAAPHILFQFEGVYKNAKVFLNDTEAGGVPYGYLPFFVEADSYLHDGENVLRVECDCADQPDSRWYTGAGIYRPVWLWSGPAASIEPESIKITTVSHSPARIKVETGREGRIEILDGTKVVAATNGATAELLIENAKLWSDEAPYLYTCRVTCGEDVAEERFGIRYVAWSKQGLFVNGTETLLRGGCLHHDHGILGAATYAESEYRRIKILKEAGFNAIRSSHNPASAAMLEACDELGLYVMDESWDMWFHHKSKFDYASDWKAHHIDDLTAMVRRDFNHPSVIMYSIGNEVSEPAKDEGIRAIEEMRSHLHQLDPSRAVTGGFNLMIISSAKKGKGVYDEDGGRKDNGSEKKMSGMNSTMFNMIVSMIGTGMNKAANGKSADLATAPGLDRLDIAGYNYASGRYPLEAKAHPDRIVVGSETFPQDLPKNWGMVKKFPYLIGDFMWTAWDYLGEAGIGTWAYTEDGKGFNKPYPWLLGDTGAFDILGDPTGEAFLASAVWGKAKGPKICVRPLNHDMKPAKSAWRGTNAIPSWSFRNCDRKKATVEVYANAARVELRLNDRRVGMKSVKDFCASFTVRYEQGTLTAITYDAAGKETGKTSLSSASARLGIQIAPEAESAAANGLLYIPIRITDSKGIVESNADRRLTVTVEGGELLAFGSANPRTEERFDSGSYTTYYGQALAIVRAGSGGAISLKVTDGEATAEATVPIRSV